MSVVVPAGVREGVAAALGRSFGTADFRASAVGGGCIAAAARIEMGTGDVAFLKWAEPGRAAPGMFAAEAASLKALAAARAVRVPAVLAVSDPPATVGADPVAAGGGAPEGGGEESARASHRRGDAPGWLLLEWLEPGRPSAGTAERLGGALAALHRVRGAGYGWPEDNFIGSLPQPNRPAAEWPAFWRERRLEPQLRRAVDGGAFDVGDRRRFGRLLDRLDELLAGAGADGASLLHGDLWSGNVHVMAGGEAALVDPASYYGHREVDLAMAELFGGFDAAFFHAYREAWPVEPAYAAVRRPIYQLYYLLVHVNLFGRGYVGSTLAALGAAGV
ncbi:MAG TPA: fructosamine kinase family protein [Longimicrobiales bacterium]